MQRPRGAWIFEIRTQPSRVYDGDTLRAEVDLGFRHWFDGMRIRLWGIDAPELKGPTNKEGRAARDRLRELVRESDQLLFQSLAPDPGKYGRYLGTVFAHITHERIHATLDGAWVNLGSLMLLEGHARPYV
jgi:micrococcal nuclease